MTTPLRPVAILLVEDNQGDVDLMMESFEELQILVAVTVARDGEEAMDILFKRGAHIDASTPDIIFLDLNLPKRDGREVLHEVKTTPILSRIPVVVLTSSSAESDILRAYDLHANCYITKPVGFQSLMKTIQSIQEFWFNVAMLPRSGWGGSL